MCYQCTGIKKKTIVVFYDPVLKRENKGKVVAVNRWGLTIKAYKNKHLLFLSTDKLVISAYK